MVTPLCELANKYGSDKSPTHKGLRPGHSYTPFYYELFKDRPVKRLLEIGVETGASLRMWRDFFPEAIIVGLDIDRQTIFMEGRIYTLIGDSSDAESAREFGNAAPFDIIIDDGEHDPESQYLTWRNFFPLLEHGGTYVVEDVRAVLDKWPWGQSAIREFRTDFPSGDDRLIVMSKQ